MPIYEYRCDSCQRKQSFLILSISKPFSPKCKFCGGEKLTRLISKVAVLKSESSRLENLADPTKWGDLDENDPRSVARWMKKMGKEMGEDFGEEIEQIAEEAAREGEEKEMPIDD